MISVAFMLLLQLCPSLWDLMDLSLPGSSVHGILQARFLEWVAVPSSRGSSPPRDHTLKSLAFVGGFFTASATWEGSLGYRPTLRRVA